MVSSTRTRRVSEWCRQHERSLRRIVIGLGIAIVLIQWGRLCVKQRGDYDLHWHFSQRIVAGTFLYEGGTDRPYPPFWALAHAPLTFLDVHLSQLLVFPLFVAALALLLWVLDRMTRERLPMDRNAAFWVSVLAIIASSRFLVRDMMECGVNLALVAMAWLAVYLWSRRREWTGGAVLGLAIALKCTPGLFLAYFVLKRQWKMAAITTAAAALFTLSPALFMGVGEYRRAMEYWVASSWSGVGQSDPSMGVLGQEQLQNISLRPTLARFLMHLPDGHKLRVDHPLYVDLLNLPPHVAGTVTKLLMAALLAAVAWSFRHRVQRRDDLAIGWECATVSLMILLYSPITWGQHCVGVLPAFYLLGRTWAAGGKIPTWMYATLGMYALFILVLNRELIGKELTWLLDSYHMHTWCFLAVIGVAVAWQRRCRMPAMESLAAPATSAPLAPGAAA